MQNRWFHIPRLHVPRHGHERKVGWLELFYDLIYVAAIIQLGNALSHHVSISGFLAFFGLFIPIWWAWTGFTFYNNRFVVDDFLHRCLVFVQMFGIGGMAVSVGDVLDGGTEGFAIFYALVRFVLVAMYARVWAQHKETRDMTGRMSIGMLVGAALWLSSVLVEGPWVFAFWGLALLADGISTLGPGARRIAAKYPPDVMHFTERYGLLTIIVLGETFVKVLSAVADERAAPVAGATHDFLFMGVLGVLITVSMWWIYFDDVAGSRIRHSKLAPYVWVYSHLPLTVAVTAVGVAVKKATISMDPGLPAPDKYRWLLCGTIALALVSVALIDMVTERRQAELSDKARVNMRLFSALLVLGVGLVGGFVPAAAFLAMATGTMLLQVFFDLFMAPELDAEAAHHEDPALKTAPEQPDPPTPDGRARRWDVADAIRKGAPSEFRRDLYFMFMERSWWTLGVALVVVYVLLNGIFAGLYLLDPGGQTGVEPGSLLQSFWFSVHTFTTIGYGTMAPDSDYSQFLMSIQALLGIVGVAIVTGLVFAKASRPHASLLFSRFPVINNRNGKPTLCFRVGNARGNDIVEATIRVTVLKNEISPEGHSLRRLHDLKLQRMRQPIFALSWTVLHVIDEDSPLYGVTEENIHDRIFTMVATLVGHDATYAQTVHSRTLYYPEFIRFNERYVDIIGSHEDGRLTIDYGHFHDTETMPEDHSLEG